MAYAFFASHFPVNGGRQSGMFPECFGEGGLRLESNAFPYEFYFIRVILGVSQPFAGELHTVVIYVGVEIPVEFLIDGLRHIL